MRVAEQHSSKVIRLPEILSALSFALDLTEGAVPGHTVRSTLLGMRIAKALRVPEHDRAALYYALQLKDVGCSSNAARMSILFGADDRGAKALAKITDFSGIFSLEQASTLRAKGTMLAGNLLSGGRGLRRTWQAVLPTGSVGQRARRMLHLAAHTEENTRELLTTRCDRGASILRKLEMSEMSCETVHKLDERWDGRGYPEGLAGNAIPLLARISSVAQTLDCFATAYGMDAAVATVRRRSGSWFDPAVVKVAAALDRAGTLWQACAPDTAVDLSRQAVIAIAPADASVLREEQIDAICEAFADVVDAKSPFTHRHSMGVTEVAGALAEEMGFNPERKALIRRAALMHDLGKLGISNTILDKPAKLSDEERRAVLEHPRLSCEILSRISRFEELACIAGQHHERLDGSGYPHGLSADALSLESRLLMVADSFSALAERRPYRDPLPVAAVMEILARDVPHKLDPQVFHAMEQIAERWQISLPEVFNATEPETICELPKWRKQVQAPAGAAAEAWRAG